MFALRSQSVLAVYTFASLTDRKLTAENQDKTTSVVL